MQLRSEEQNETSIVRGLPLDEEPGLGELTVPGYLRAVTNRFGDREALVWRGGNGPLRWSYAQIWDRSVEVARALLALGVSKDARVGILMTNRPEMLAAAFGTSLAGGVAVLLNTFSTSSELAHQIGVSGVEILLFERHIAGKDLTGMLAGLEPRLRSAEPGRLHSTRFPFLRHLATLDSEGDSSSERAIMPWSDFIGHGSAIPRELVDATAAVATPADAGALFFSSGTTSLPKGVLHAHRAIAIQWWRWGRLMGMEDPVRSWTANGFFWSGNFSMVVGGTFTSGGSLLLQSTFDPEEALELMQAERVSFALAWPHQWAKLEAAPSWKSADLGSLRYVKDGTPGARHPTVHAAWLSPPSYGATETLTISTAFSSTTPHEVVAGSHGEPLPGNILKIVDPETGAVRPRGVSGEIAVKGPTLMLGYVGIPLAETLDEEGFFRTGDSGQLDSSGRLYWAGRLSDVIKTGGANVSPSEVDAILSSHADVKLCKTVGIPHETLGEMVVACIVPRAGARVEESAIRAFARESLASYKVPRRVLFFRDDELEMTGSDKVKTNALRTLCIERLAAPGERG